MICSKCGIELPDNTQFCSNCGTPVTQVIPDILSETDADEIITSDMITEIKTEQEETAHANNISAVDDQSAYEIDTLESRVDKKAKRRFGNKILFCSLLSLWFGGFLGIVFAAIAKSRAEEYTYLYGIPKGRARVGKNIAAIAMVIGIITSVIYAIAISSGCLVSFFAFVYAVLFVY